MMRMPVSMRPLLLGGMLGFLAVPAAASAADYTVTMANMSYGKLPSALKVGDTITWVNHDTVPHTITARDKSFDLRTGPGQSAKMTLDKDGSFAFFCIYHAMMRGTLKVAAK
jgi:plastocyanin